MYFFSKFYYYKIYDEIFVININDIFRFASRSGDF